DRAAEHRLAHPVLGAAPDPYHEPPGVERAEALTGDGAAVEAELRQHVRRLPPRGSLVDPGPRDLPGQLRAEDAVVSVGGARKLLADRLAGEHPVGEPGKLRRGL